MDKAEKELQQYKKAFEQEWELYLQSAKEIMELKISVIQMKNKAKANYQFGVKEVLKMHDRLQDMKADHLKTCNQAIDFLEEVPDYNLDDLFTTHIKDSDFLIFGKLEK